VVAIVNTHLHFDHCGQNDSLPGVPVWVRADEVEAARTEGYTVPEWATIPPERLRLAADGEEIASGVRLVATPGHTPGHQSVVVTDRDGNYHIVAGQCCHSGKEWAAGAPAATDMYDPGLVRAGIDSLERLLELAPVAVFFSHDPDPYRTPRP
jgi:N-acyl homoserine lactone hydrolase